MAVFSQLFYKAQSVTISLFTATGFFKNYSKVFLEQDTCKRVWLNSIQFLFMKIGGAELGDGPVDKNTY